MWIEDRMKKFFSGICTLLVLPMFLCYKFAGVFCDQNSVFAAWSQFFSLIPGKTGSYLRNSFYQLTMTSCSGEIVFSFGTLFSQVDTDIGSGTYIGPQCNIGSCNIGRNCLLGSGVHILSGKQQHSTTSLDVPIKDQGGTFSKIRIGDDCWIGNGAIVMADIGTQCVVAAGAVVINPVEDRVIVAGNPATVIKKR